MRQGYTVIFLIWSVLCYVTYSSLSQAQQSGSGGVWFTQTDNNPFDGQEYVEGYEWTYDGTSWTYGPPIDLLDHLEGGHNCPEHPIDPSVPVSTVPLPAAVWLFGSAVIGLLAVGRGRRKHVEHN